MIFSDTSKAGLSDLHCDLLWYLSLDPKRTALDSDARCSIPQLKAGKVRIQTMAIFTETNDDSVASGLRQAEIFRTLPIQYPDSFQRFRKGATLDSLLKVNKIGILPAVENASAFCLEKEELEHALERLGIMQRKIGKLLYVSLTWNSENRFGGGAATNVGLKNDGKLLVDYLAENGIAVDFSHTSDFLAYDLLNYIAKKGYSLPVLASHSNLRSVTDVPRNLPDDIVKEIIRKNGLIGINFVRSFLGSRSPQFFSMQLDRFLKLGAGKNICFGADFFCVDDLPEDIRRPLDETFFPSYNHAGAYGRVIDLWKKELALPDSVLEDICMGNFMRFFASFES